MVSGLRGKEDNVIDDVWFVMFQAVALCRSGSTGVNPRLPFGNMCWWT